MGEKRSLERSRKKLFVTIKIEIGLQGGAIQLRHQSSCGLTRRRLSKTSRGRKINETFKLWQISRFIFTSSILRLLQLNVVAAALAVVVDVVVAGYWFSTNVISSTSDDLHFKEQLQLHDSIAQV